MSEDTFEGDRLDGTKWAPEREGGLRVSSLQTGAFSGPAGTYPKEFTVDYVRGSS
ncbi:hypothetical protein ACIBI9_12550 [Nonomuraea sp. NPDC050451]|uniref:hypothetical protein n=1 Tax=Nonomuraea sp. NPDC050451 TaxID=3364364 RepID=UPI0037A922F1